MLYVQKQTAFRPLITGGSIMSEHTTSSRGRWFSLLYATRVQVSKGEVNVINLSLVFTLLAVMSAPWVAVAGLIAALALGYRFRISRNDPAFSGSFNDMMQNAARNVQNAVDSVVENKEE